MLEIEYKTLNFKFHRTQTISNTRSYPFVTQCPDIHVYGTFYAKMGLVDCIL